METRSVRSCRVSGEGAVEGSRPSETPRLATKGGTWQYWPIEKLHERNGHSRNGDQRIADTEVDVVLNSLEGQHWYEAVTKFRREHLKWMKSNTHYLNYFMPREMVNWMMEKGPEESEKISKDARIRGSQIHTAQAQLSFGETLRRRDFSPEVWQHIITIRNWVEDFQPQFVNNEEIVYDPDFLKPEHDDVPGLAGTADMTYVLPAEVVEKKLKKFTGLIREEIGGVMVMGDTKSGSRLYEKDFVQVTGYAHMKNKLGPDPLTGVPVELIALLRSNSKHKRGYELVFDTVCEQRVEVLYAMKTAVDHFDEQKEPRFPAKLPDEIRLPE